MSDYVDSYYRDTNRVTLAPTPRLAGAARADVAIVGGGVTGVSAALSLAERGYDVALLEANRIGWGASGRSGGQILTGFGTGMSTFAEALGATAARHIFAMSREAVSHTVARIETHAIDCDLRPGAIYAALKPRHMTEFARERDMLQRDYDYDGLTLLDDEALAARVQSPRYIGGLRDAESWHLHPLNYVRGLAHAAQTVGARLYEDSAAVRIEPGSRPVVHTATGRLQADWLVLAGNAYLAADLVPELSGHVMPVGNYIIATEPLREDQVASSLPGDDALSDANFVLDYYRLSTPPGTSPRLLYGGQVSYGHRPPRRLVARMQAKLGRLFPALAGIGIDYSWGGLVGVTRNRAPHFGRVGDNIFYAQGYSGHGMAFAGLAGGLIGDAVAGQAERFDLYARMAHRRFPGGTRLRTPLLVLATNFYRMRDLI
ncbi:FAD-binding oxidoreductase [Salinisphaera sp. Q1T1-3]|uniref:NAD(P)/FAD-dependent oxidoreductase n=1 Tax=Salinisphaera sp. Q1T1-3 TaxID=2321229 RepID=UPI000E722B86|nr:FAD-binding oxidoreductase [Salinisphaera sp. Q1T1-3]RJS93295.1 FAD-binding oxidoreductase [Salinisphaera sp. Q1T1-3]